MFQRDDWAGRAGKGEGKGGGGKGVESEHGKNIFERKMFDKRVSKISGEKGEKGEREFKAWLFDVRKVTKEAPPFHEFLEWIGDLQVEVTDEELAKKKVCSPTWDMVWLNKQLYGILSETCQGKLKETVMRREKEGFSKNG